MSVYRSDGELAYFVGPDTIGHDVLWHGRARAMPLFKLFGTGTNHRAKGTERA